MSAPINDGGPAFPHFKFSENGKVEICPQGGMTLRDYFAGQALTGVIPSIETEIDKLDTDSKHFDHNVNCFYQSAAIRSYCYADAMISTREARK